MKSYLNNDSVFGKDSNRKNKFLLIFVGLLALLGIGGGVLAANITVGTGTVEFGQGSAEAIACDTSITVTPVSTYTASGFIVTSIVLGDVNQNESTSPNGGCGAQNIVVKALNSTSPLASATVTIPTAAATSNFTISPSPTVTANDLNRITIESTN
jgi:hypothetical protein